MTGVFLMPTLGEDYLDHERFGIGARVDYKLARAHRVFLNTMYSDYNDMLDRRHITMTPHGGADPARLDGESDGDVQPSDELRAESPPPRRWKRSMWCSSAGKSLRRAFVDYGASSPAFTGTEDRVIPTVRITASAFRFDRSDLRCLPRLQTSGPDDYDRTEQPELHAPDSSRISMTRTSFVGRTSTGSTGFPRAAGQRQNRAALARTGAESRAGASRIYLRGSRRSWAGLNPRQESTMTTSRNSTT